MLQNSKKYNTLSEFCRECASAYNAAKNNDWLKDYTWLKIKQKYNWNFETCREVSLKYTCRSEFAKNCPGGYHKASINHWLDKFTWLEDRTKDISKRTGNNNVVYAYIFNDYKAVYVGRTNDINRRDRDHLFASEKDDTTIRFCKLHNIAMPNVTILETKLSLVESKEKEAYYIDLYKKQEYYIINKAKCGRNSSSIGSIGNYMWTYEKCYEAAKKYEYVSVFGKECSGAYKRAKKEGWLKDYTWFNDGKIRSNKRRTIWTYEKCYEAAKKYNTRSEFWKGNSSAYKSACKHKWLDEYTWFRKKVK